MSFFKKYMRLKAFLRYKFCNKRFNKWNLFIALAIYFLCSLSVLLLPHDILSQYPFLRKFTDFMEILPVVTAIEQKTPFAGELAKFYFCYMFIIGLICSYFIGRECLFYVVYSITCPYPPLDIQGKKSASRPKLMLLCLMIVNPAVFWVIKLFIAGETIGTSKFRRKEEEYIHGYFDLIKFVDYDTVLLFAAIIFFIFMVNIIWIDYYILLCIKGKDYIKRRFKLNE